MSLSDSIQALIYDIDTLLDGGSDCQEELLDKRRSLDTTLLRRAAIEVKAATQGYLDTMVCIDEAKSCFVEATESLEKVQSFIEKLAKVVEGVERLI
jgi:hypothetical protein